MNPPLAILRCLLRRIDWWAVTQYGALCLACGRALADFWQWLQG